jgi:uncharacterized membrane protein
MIAFPWRLQSEEELLMRPVFIAALGAMLGAVAGALVGLIIGELAFADPEACLDLTCGFYGVVTILGGQFVGAILGAVLGVRYSLRDLTDSGSQTDG